MAQKRDVFRTNLGLRQRRRLRNLNRRGACEGAVCRYVDADEGLGAEGGGVHELELLEGVGTVVRLQSEAQTGTVSSLTELLAQLVT